MGEDNTTKPVKINQTLPDGTVLNDMSKGNFDVRVSTGPSYTTKRVETAEMLMELTRSVPKIGELGADILVDNLDISGADKLAERLRKTLPPELLEDEDGEPIPTAPPPPPPPPNPADVAKADKDSAAADKLKAEAEQVRLDNIARMTS